MSDFKILKPKIPGDVIRDPKTREPLPADGKAVNLSGKEGSFWRRRLADESVIEVAALKSGSKSPELPKGKE